MLLIGDFAPFSVRSRGIEEDLNAYVPLTNVAPLVDRRRPPRWVRVVLQVLLDHFKYLVLSMGELSAEEERLVVDESPLVLQTAVYFLLQVPLPEYAAVELLQMVAIDHEACILFDSRLLILLAQRVELLLQESSLHISKFCGLGD